MSIHRSCLIALAALAALSAVSACKEEKPVLADSAGPPTTTTTTTTATSPPKTQAETATPTTPAACDSLSRTRCLATAACVLEKGAAPSEYICRDARGPCEIGHAQQDQPACAAIAGCTYDPGGCYCACRGYGQTKAPDDDARGCKCVCAGGSPGICRASDAGTGTPDSGGAPAPTSAGTALAGFVLTSNCWQQGTALTTHVVTIASIPRTVEVKDNGNLKGNAAITPAELEPLAKLLGGADFAKFAHEAPVTGVPHPGMTGCDLEVTSPTLNVKQHWSDDDTFSAAGQAVRTRLYLEIGRFDRKVTKP